MASTIFVVTDVLYDTAWGRGDRRRRRLGVRAVLVRVADQSPRQATFMIQIEAYGLWDVSLLPSRALPRSDPLRVGVLHWAEELRQLTIAFALSVPDVSSLAHIAGYGAFTTDARRVVMCVRGGL
jgi:hypothetical protein